MGVLFTFPKDNNTKFTSSFRPNNKTSIIHIFANHLKHHLYCISNTIILLHLARTHHLGTAALTALQSGPLPVVRVAPLVTLHVPDHQLAVAAHADHLLTGGAVPRVARQQASVGAALRAGLAARLFT